VPVASGGVAEGPASDLSSRAQRSGVEGPAFSPGGGHSLPELPFSGDYCGDHHSRECECCRIRPDSPITPEAVEFLEVSEKFGNAAASVRRRQLERNRQQRVLRTERKRYEAIALERNLQRAADIMAERKLAERDAKQVSVEGCPILPSSGGVGPVPAADATATSTPDQKRPVASADASLNLPAAAAKSSA
jgi:hypothetical protein